MNDASLAAALLGVDPGLGAVLRGPPDPSRADFLDAVRDALGEGAPFRKMPAGIDDGRLLGGLDLSATLAAGRRVAERGLLAACDGGVLVVAMAERLEPRAASLLAVTMDTGEVCTERDGLSCRDEALFGVIALDEGIDEALPATLADRLAFHIRPDGEVILPSRGLAAARALLPDVSGGEDDAAALVVTCARLGIASLRAPLLAWRAARAAAALAGRGVVEAADLEVAARLVLAPRATMLPEEAPPEPEPDMPEDTAAREQTGRLADTVLEAARAALPADLLASLARGAAQRARAGGSAGAVRRNAQRGCTIGVRAGEPRGGARLYLLATLRAAAPWQRARGAAPGTIAIRRGDFRLRRFRQRTRTVTIFVVDASGSAAVHRLAEAKGAVELLLAECYVRRDRVALLSVRGEGAELVLPPTSSLARAKKCLAGLPGGGGTPLAAGFAAALSLADGVRRAGQTPVGVFLTDGRPNVALDGGHGRPAAEADALGGARAWRAAGHTALLVDLAVRPHPFARHLAEAACARYLALPQPGALAEAARHAGALGDAVRQAANG